METNTTHNSANNENVISHRQRQLNEDVNPLLKSSQLIINSVDDNFVVGRQKSGQLSKMGPNRIVGLSFKDRTVQAMKERFLDNFVKYYEVDKKGYPFSIRLNSSTSQPTLKFTVRLDFTLQVIDPCPIVEGNVTSLLECVLQDLKKLVDMTTSRFLVQYSNDAKLTLQANLDNFTPPPYLRLIAGAVDVGPDAEALVVLRQVEEEEIRLQGVGVDTAVNTAKAIGTVLQEKVPSQIEDHHAAKMVPLHSLIQRLSSGNTPPES